MVLPPSRTRAGRSWRGRAQDPARVDARMVEEAAVLDRDHRVGRVGRQILEPDVDAAEAAAGGEDPAVGGLEQERRLRVRLRLVGQRQGHGDVDDGGGSQEGAHEQQDQAGTEHPAEPRRRPADERPGG